MEKRTGKLRPLNRPRSVRVEADLAGVPVRMEINGRWEEVGTILDRWRIDDEWWRAPVSRVYFSLVLTDGAHLTLYQDLIEDRWYRQSG